MSIASEISRLQTAKADIKTAIEGKGVEVGENLTISSYAPLIDSIETGLTIDNSRIMNFMADETIPKGYFSQLSGSLNERTINKNIVCMIKFNDYMYAISKEDSSYLYINELSISSNNVITILRSQNLGVTGTERFRLFDGGNILLFSYAGSSNAYTNVLPIIITENSITAGTSYAPSTGTSAPYYHVNDVFRVSDSETETRYVIGSCAGSSSSHLGLLFQLVSFDKSTNTLTSLSQSTISTYTMQSSGDHNIVLFTRNDIIYSIIGADYSQTIGLYRVNISDNTIGLSRLSYNTGYRQCSVFKSGEKFRVIYNDTSTYHLMTQQIDLNETNTSLIFDSNILDTTISTSSGFLISGFEVDDFVLLIRAGQTNYMEVLRGNSIMDLETSNYTTAPSPNYFRYGVDRENYKFYISLETSTSSTDLSSQITQYSQVAGSIILGNAKMRIATSRIDGICKDGLNINETGQFYTLY